MYNVQNNSLKKKTKKTKKNKKKTKRKEEERVKGKGNSNTRLSDKFVGNILVSTFNRASSSLWRKTRDRRNSRRQRRALVALQSTRFQLITVCTCYYTHHALTCNALGLLRGGHLMKYYC
jgi:CRISPR/Cas system Type II protein with McrA/HNH and RuvC-like nuclease domain